MLTKIIKAVVILSLSISAFVLSILPWLPAEYQMENLKDLLYAISFYKWEWLLACFLVALSLVLCWKCGNSVLKAIVIFFSVISLILALLWGLWTLLFIGGIPGL